MKRILRADVLLIENIRVLLHARGLHASALAVWCGHKPAWISKVLAGERGIPVRDLGKVADFFGITVSQLFQHGIAVERRVSQRRSAYDRRSGIERRGTRNGIVHPDVLIRFPNKAPDSTDDRGHSDRFQRHRESVRRGESPD